MKSVSYIAFFLVAVALVTPVRQTRAQDTSRKQSVEIVSAFRPVLKNASKLSFTATPPAPDAATVQLTYSIPVQHLYFQLQPVALKPLALPIDTSGLAHNSNYVKLGFGNYRSPLVEAGISLGDGKKNNFNLLAGHLSQRGDLRVQRFSTTHVTAYMNSLVNKVEVYGKAGFRQQTNYLYGPDPALIATKDDSLRKPYQTFTVQAGVRNAFVTMFGASYNPHLTVSVFGDTRSSETNALLDVPIEFRMGTNFAIHLRGKIDFTTYRPTGQSSYTNNVYSVNPAVAVKFQKLKVRAGVRPTWDNGKLYVLPDVLAEAQLKDQKAILIAGWTAELRKNNYESLAAQNPWINQPLSQFNTRITDVFGGFKGSLAHAFNYRLQFGFKEFLGQPLFVNALKPSVFEIRRESKLHAFHTQAELGFVVQDQLTAGAKLDWYNFLSQQTEAGAWHMIPLMVTGSARWKPAKIVTVKADVFAWQGARVLLTPAGSTGRLPAVFDLNAGVEVKAASNIYGWLQLNNLFNNAYERWHNYPVLGFQILAGIKLTFDQKL
jgi:hypothetical protein